MAMVLQRVADGARNGPSAPGARGTLEMATPGGARVPGRDDIGAPKPGMAADIITGPRHEIGLAAALHGPLAVRLFCRVSRFQHAVINGRLAVRDGQITTPHLTRLIEQHDRLALRLGQAAR